MPEKEAKQFAQAEKGQTFELNTQKETRAVGEKQITLNIAEARGNKILLRKQDGSMEYTGNFVVDSFKKMNDYLIDHSKVKLRDKATFFRLLAVMLNAGLPLIRSLNTLGVQSEKSPHLAKVLFDLARQIEAGRSLSDAMADYPDIFGDAETGVIRAGEASGQLNKTLKSLADEIEKSASVTGKIKGALVYPVVIMVLLISVIFLMMIMVIPQMTKLFTQTGAELPLPTRILIGISEFSVNYWPFVIGGLAASIFGIGVWKKTRSGKYIWDYMKLKMPVFGSIMQKGALSKFARGFSNLMGSGVPIIKSIEIVAHSIGNEVYKKRLLLTAEDMKRGIPMAENLSESSLFPKILVNMIEVGEQTAQLETVVLKVAEFYDEEIDNVVASLTKIMEPLILVIIGVTVGGLVAAIMLPIIQLTNIAGGT
ncbi:type II secretion system F family protein [Candidatus Peregrinibacteria bacterium]|nr:type II secretion system F family protein [Candidatus Peregrinibacteria bacterium]